MDVKKYNRWNPTHWVIAMFSNSRKVDYTPEGGDALFRCPSKTTANTRICYWFRNIAHDFMAYIIGFVDEPYEMRGIWHKGNWNGYFLYYKHVYFPFIRWRVRYWEFYCGWRDGGIAGFKFRKHTL